MKNLLNGNFAAKVLAVVAACLLWLFVMNEQNPQAEMTYTIPLEQRNVAGNLLVFNAPESVRVRVRGPRTLLSNVLGKDLKAYVDLTGLGEGRYAVKVKTQAPLPMEVVEVEPEQIMLRTDTNLERTFPVELQFIGDPTAEVTVGKTLIVPNQIKISGPSSNVATVMKVVARVNLQNRELISPRERLIIEVSLRNQEENARTLFDLSPYRRDIMRAELLKKHLTSLAMG